MTEWCFIIHGLLGLLGLLMPTIGRFSNVVQRNPSIKCTQGQTLVKINQEVGLAESDLTFACCSTKNTATKKLVNLHSFGSKKFEPMQLSENLKLAQSQRLSWRCYGIKKCTVVRICVK